MTQKLTKPQQRIVHKAKHTRIMRTNNVNGEDCFGFMDGAPVHAGVVRRLIEMGKLKEFDDGLMPGCSQTYGAE